MGRIADTIKYSQYQSDDKRIKVLIVVASLQKIGGAERMVVNLAKNLDLKCFNLLVCVLYPRNNSPFEKELKQGGIKVCYLNKKRGLDFRVLIKLCQLFLRFRPQVVHTHQYILRYTLLPTLLARVPVRVHTIHSIATEDAKNFVTRWTNRVAFKYLFVGPVSVSAYVSNTVKELYGLENPLIYNGVDFKMIDCYSSSKTWFPNKIVFLYAGRFVAEKNLIMLISTFAKAIAVRDNLHFLLLGDGPEKKKIEQFIHQHKLHNVVSLLPPCPDITKVIKEADVIVLFSYYEGLPMIILEAMALKKPVIATAVGGVPEIVRNGVTGILIPPDNKEAMRNAMLRLAENHIIRSKMGEKGYQLVQKQFLADSMAKRYQELYMRILKNK